MAERDGGVTGAAPLDLERALEDPAAVFGAPEAVVDRPDLAPAQKAEILRRWEYDAAENAVATEEGMPDGGRTCWPGFLPASTG